MGMRLLHWLKISNIYMDDVTCSVGDQFLRQFIIFTQIRDFRCAHWSRVPPNTQECFVIKVLLPERFKLEW